jgi:Tfp pilus assembly protein PilF
MNFGRMLMKKGDPAAAKVYLRRALLLKPSYQGARSLLASLESSPEEAEEAGI